MEVQGGNNQVVNPLPLQANDSDADSDSITSILYDAPSHGTIAPLSDPGAINSIDPDGGFVYTPAAGFGGYDTFTYFDSDGMETSRVATVHILVQKLDIEIWDGGPTGAVVPANKETSRGGFGVVNQNNTNGDVSVDDLQHPVTATPRGLDEYDLMILSVNPPDPPIRDTSITISLSPGLDVWTDEVKTDAYPHFGDPTSGEMLTVPVNSLMDDGPLDIFVEVTRTSVGYGIWRLGLSTASPGTQ